MLENKAYIQNIYFFFRKDLKALRPGPGGRGLTGPLIFMQEYKFCGQNCPKLEMNLVSEKMAW